MFFFFPLEKYKKICLNSAVLNIGKQNRTNCFLRASISADPTFDRLHSEVLPSNYLPFKLWHKQSVRTASGVDVAVVLLTTTWTFHIKEEQNKERR